MFYILIGWIDTVLYVHFTTLPACYTTGFSLDIRNVRAVMITIPELPYEARMRYNNYPTSTPAIVRTSPAALTSSHPTTIASSSTSQSCDTRPNLLLWTQQLIAILLDGKNANMCVLSRFCPAPLRENGMPSRRSLIRVVMRSYA